MRDKPQASVKRRVKKAAIIIVAVVLSYVAFSMVGSVIIFKAIFSRSDTVNAFELTYADVDTQKYPRREIRFYSGDNLLYGCIYRPAGDSEGLILLANGINCRADRHLPEIMYFVDSGFTVMTFENTGVGNSEGGGTKGLAQARLDLVSAADYIKADEELSSLPLLMYGHSLGGYAVASSLKDVKNVSAAVCVAGFNSPNENMLKNAEKYVGFLADLQYPFMCLQNYFLFGEAADDTAVEGINSVDAPVMIISGSSDDIVTSDVSISSSANDITNQNVVTVEIDEPYRSEHNTLWLSAESAEYLCESDSPDDKSRANVLDEDFMKSIVDFYFSSMRTAK